MDFRCAYSSAKRIAVTGATGYVGSGFAKGFTPMALEDVPSGAVIVHLAARVAHDDPDTYAINSALDAHLISLVNTRHAGVVYASSNNVYPMQINCEAGRTSPVVTDYYSASKIHGESLVSGLCRRPWIIARIADVFGVGQRHGNLFRMLESSIRNRHPLVLRDAGTKVRSYIYQPELTAILAHLAESIHGGAGGGVLNICYPDSKSVADIAIELGKASGLPVEVGPDEESPNIRTLLPSCIPGYKLRLPTLTMALQDYGARAKNQDSLAFTTIAPVFG